MNPLQTKGTVTILCLFWNVREYDFIDLLLAYNTGLHIQQLAEGSYRVSG